MDLSLGSINMLLRVLSLFLVALVLMVAAQDTFSDTMNVPIEETYSDIPFYITNLGTRSCPPGTIRRRGECRKMAATQDTMTDSEVPSDIAYSMMGGFGRRYCPCYRDPGYICRKGECHKLTPQK